MVTDAANRWDLHKIQQVVKWSVYTLLLLNWGFYIYEDWTRATYTLNAQSNLFDVTVAFATSLDLLAWFVLLLMFELETYVLEDDVSRRVEIAMRTARLICIALIAHTIIAFTQTVIVYSADQPVENASTLCDVADEGVSFVENLSYTDVTPENCASFADVDAVLWAGDPKDRVVASPKTLQLERDLAWADLLEAVVWLIVLASIEFVVRLQEKGVTGGRLIQNLNRTKLVLYSVLMGIGIYWASLGHWVYLWDEFLWIGGFMAIELNISQWRDEMIEEAANA